MNLRLGEGLLSKTSLAATTGSFRIKHIPFEALKPNDEEHGFSLDGIEELAASIADIGLEQNLVVEDNEDGTYNILTGRRRYYAIKKLIKGGNTKYDVVPCVVKKLSDIDLPISDDLKRTYAIVTTNAEQRKPTAADTAEMIRKLDTVYDALEAAGHKPKGRRRDFIAKELGIGLGTVGKYDYVSNNASGEVKAALAGGSIGINEAVALTKGDRDIDVTTDTKPEAQKKQRNRGAWTEPFPDTKQTLKRDALFLIPDFPEEEYELDGAVYEKVMKRILRIRGDYKAILKLISKGEN